MSEINESPVENIFNAAAKHFPSLISTLPKERLLFFYARYKQATEGDCNVAKPGFLDQSGRRKWEAWKSLQGTSKAKAMEEYICGVKELDPDWREDATNTSGWARVSRMPAPEDATITKFVEAVQENQLDVLKQLDLATEVQKRFDEGMTGLHWAADRGHRDVAELLLDRGADVNAQDEGGQTPLHYAASCGYEALVCLLLSRGADSTIRDVDQLTPRQVADDAAVASLFPQ
ncbi:hypothetical protein HAZT_HAZT009291 [Hyalella azteca]|uniref:Acyl-CoA-binding domain-containing protein 6 n=1 Tax=Hyalella azteca TaxID=294128 RepID=A0A6A0HDN3_HYAAZ|nr:acyl-CoA-binding domain-containing protein 6 [Hyalella azteca]KAA0203938.1 hypothetical protein HAZT_HAZT009291 [Hyalella azteca]